MIKNDKTLYKIGETCKVSGQYEIVWPRWGKLKWQERTVTKGEPFPPIRSWGDIRYVLVDKTKHKIPMGF